MSTPSRNPKNRKSHITPRAYGGKWIVWSKDGQRIVGAGKTPQDAQVAAARAGITDIIYQWVPPAGERFIGGT